MKYRIWDWKTLENWFFFQLGTDSRAPKLVELALLFLVTWNYLIVYATDIYLNVHVTTLEATVNTSY